MSSCLVCTQLCIISAPSLKLHDLLCSGRVMFEMSSKTDLIQLLPDEADLATVASSGINDVLRFIFEVNEEGKLKNNIEMV